MGEGITGERAAITMALLKKMGTVGSDQERWNIDPYAPDFKDGFLMNLSEKEEFDGMFPEDPLSMARQLVQYVISNN